MFQFPGFASPAYGFGRGSPRREGFPHSDIRGSTIARISPRLFAACHVLHRLSAPRHPPDALIMLRTTRPTPAPARAFARPRPSVRPAASNKQPTDQPIQPINQPTTVQRRRPRAEPSRATNKRRNTNQTIDRTRAHKYKRTRTRAIHPIPIRLSKSGAMVSEARARGQAGTPARQPADPRRRPGPEGPGPESSDLLEARTWRRSDSNRRPPACKAGALPAELRPRTADPGGMARAGVAQTSMRPGRHGPGRT
jgi:hypothetical protein